MSKIDFMNTEIDNLTMDEAVDAIDQIVQNRKPSYVVTPNVDIIIKMEADTKLQEIFENAALALTDGEPLLWIAKWYGTPVKEKVSGSDLFPRVCQLAAEKGYRIFLCGAAEGIAAKAAKNLTDRFPSLQVAGTYSPPYGFEKDPEKVEKVVSIIKEAAPDILIFGLGTPKQELFTYQHYVQMRVPITLCLGASIDFEAGNVKRAPRWMSDHGLEWLFRITQDPKRMFKRYIIDDTKILKLIWKYRKG